MISIDCKFFNNVIFDQKNRVAVFFATNKNVFTEILNIVFDVLFYKHYSIKSKIIKVLDFSKINYWYFDTDNQYIHYFTDIPKEEYMEAFLSKLKEGEKVGK